jgi:hypothetical protein
MIPHILLLCLFTIEISIIACRPEWISDQNKFLAGFVNHEFVATLGVILAIMLASLSQAHLTLNKIEEDNSTELFQGTRSEMLSAARWLIGLFVAGVMIVIIKPLFGTEDTPSAIFNGMACFVLAFYILILYDITTSTLSIKSNIKK